MVYVILLLGYFAFLARFLLLYCRQGPDHKIYNPHRIILIRIEENVSKICMKIALNYKRKTDVLTIGWKEESRIRSAVINID